MIKIYTDEDDRTLLISANDEINMIVSFYFHFYDENKDEYLIEAIFPEHLYRTNVERCLEVTYELREWIRDKSEHQLTPTHEYALHSIFLWIKDIERDEGRIFEDLRDIDFYIDNCFQDHDFDSAEEFFEKFIKDPTFEKRFNINLEEYKELVSKDIVKRYDRVKEEFFVLNNMLNDKVTLEKKNGEVFQDIKANVQPELIFIGDSTLHIEEGDRVIRQLSNGRTEGYIVNSSDFYEKEFAFPAHYQLKVRKETAIEHEKHSINNYYTTNFNGNNNRFNNHSTDNSTNVVSTKKEIVVFNQLREKITELDIPSAEKEKLISEVNGLEESVGKPSFIQRYQQFVATAADHLALFGPLLPELSKLLTS
ncbi:hypothetical protein OJ967_25860 [Peribacillus frigoritolerans]|uniref:hypothetical protein n=1 Tax=Peribacillus frigoritolerans TaxID=450367 RepID=UPI002225F234|nr:hypothetical protein [Peribacillus frigoritolerans]UYY98730.1 hypothetical protein OJ967_25860 [Peribacillus frigoritolerans]